MKRICLFFIFFSLYGCSDQPEFKSLDEYDPISIKIGKAYIKKLQIDDATESMDPELLISFDKTFNSIYGVNSENAAIACAERDVVAGLSDEKRRDINEKWVDKDVEYSELSLLIGNESIKNLVSDCLSPMAKKAYKKINKY